MSEARFTPGPWRASHSGVVTDNEAAPPMPEDHQRYYGGRCLVCESVSAANANLISAAPDLYAIAESVAERFTDTDSPLGKAARAALAKARGEVAK